MIIFFNPDVCKQKHNKTLIKKLKIKFRFISYAICTKIRLENMVNLFVFITENADICLSGHIIVILIICFVY